MMKQPGGSPKGAPPCPRLSGFRLGSWLLVSCGLIVGGCSLMSTGARTASDKAPRPESSNSAIKLAYESESGRLNLLTAGQVSANRTVSYQQVPAQPTDGYALPPFTRCRLSLVAPHPQGKVGYALAVLTVLPESALDGESALASLWSQLAGEQAGEPSTLDSAIEIWSTDVPQWQVEQLVTRLKNEDFFRRQRVFNAEARLLTEIDGVRFGKPTAAIAELDALIVRVRRDGRLVRHSTAANRPSSGPALPELMRLPPVIH